MNELIYALMQTGMTYRQAEEESLQDAKENEIVKGSQRRLKAALLRRGVSFPFDTILFLVFLVIGETINHSRNRYGTQSKKPICLKCPLSSSSWTQRYFLRLHRRNDG
jgi:hypothetical protein